MDWQGDGLAVGILRLTFPEQVGGEVDLDTTGLHFLCPQLFGGDGDIGGKRLLEPGKVGDRLTE